MFLSLFSFFLSFLQGISSDGNGDIPVGDLQNVLLHERAKAPRSHLRPLSRGGGFSSVLVPKLGLCTRRRL